MSDLNKSPDGSPAMPAQSDKWAGLKARSKWYALVALIVILGLAWIDGGEEPLRPIVHQVEWPKE